MMAAIDQHFLWKDEEIVDHDPAEAAEHLEGGGHWKIWPGRRALHASYVSQVLRLTPPAPAIVEVILDWRQPPNLALNRPLEVFPLDWKKQ